MTQAFIPHGRAVPETPRPGRSAADPYRLGRGPTGGKGPPARGHGTGGPAPKRIVVSYGFWLFILSDIVMFAAFFAAYAVLRGNDAGGPTPADAFDLTSTKIETACLLLSSYSCGAATLAARVKNARVFYAAMAVTCLLGMAFIGLELHEFAGLVAHGAGPQRSAFLSAFFALVGCHGLHVSIGILWLLTMMAQVFAKGFRDDIMRRFACWSVFWHALDIIWVGVFTIVYLLGAKG